MYVLYDDFSEKIGYEAFRNVYNDKTYKNITPGVDCYPFNNEFSNQFTSGNKLEYDQVVNLREQYKDLIPWKQAYESYREIYPDPWTFWNIYNGNRFKLVMPEVFTEENKRIHTSYRSASGEKNSHVKLTQQQVDQIRLDFEQGVKTRKELQQEYNFVSSTSINNILRYKTWNK